MYVHASQACLETEEAWPRLLTFTTLYPSATRPQHGLFVERRLRALVDAGAAATVLAPVPWFPVRHPFFGRYAALAQTPREEERHGLRVVHPRYPLVPKLGMTTAPVFLAASARREVRRLLRNGLAFDLIDAHYFYPDGVAAAMLGETFRRPVVITARGSDINHIPRHPPSRMMIRWAAERAAAVITVCEALKKTLVALGVPEAKVTVLRNGVDLDFFHSGDRSAQRACLGLRSPVLLSVGYLIARKGHDLAIRALSLLPDATLLIAGDGPEASSLRTLARELGVAGRVLFLGAVPQSGLRPYYAAADALVLASEREGWANVLLEAMACGTPVVATAVWGTPEVVAAPAAGVLVRERTPQAIAAGVRSLLADPPDRAATRGYAERFGWEEVAAAQLALYRKVLAGNERRGRDEVAARPG